MKAVASAFALPQLALKHGYIATKLINQVELKENNTVTKLVQDWYSNYAEKNRKKPLQIKQQIDADIIPLLGDIFLKWLGHKMPRIMATYNKDEMLAERKEALNQWTNYIESFVYSDNIIPLLKAI